MLKTPLLVFDLDDTLYDELTYVHSGFLAVSKFLEQKFDISSKKTFEKLKENLKIHGRGSNFDTLLKEEQIFTKALLKTCVKVYRHHTPKIDLYPDAKRLLKRYKDTPLFIVTDGHKIAQNMKIKALKLEKEMNRCYLTNRYGIKYQKPSPACFLMICKKMGVDPKDVVYIADNPNKDFVGLKPLGFHTIRILRGRYKEIFLGKNYEADQTIESLDEL